MITPSKGVSDAKKSKTNVTITTKVGEIIEGIPVHAESGVNGSPDWIIRQSNGSNKKVNLDDIVSVS